VDIFDTQLHIGRGRIEPTLAAMDALGIGAVLLDEFWGTWASPDPTHIHPGYALPNGAWRSTFPTAEEAASVHPERFSYLVRIDRRDPELESVMRLVAGSPHARAFRLQPVWTAEEASEFASGGYDELFDIAQDLGLPVFLFVPGYAELLPRYADRYPDLSFVVDHCGMGFGRVLSHSSSADIARTTDVAYFEVVLRLAEHPNLALKWSHATDIFGVHEYPYEPLRPLLRRALEAFGPERVMWASDSSVIRHETWGDLLHSVRDDPELSTLEREWVLGRAARRILHA
jgi:predicted TIM-barrel fold metal-dependent hydrolase